MSVLVIGSAAAALVGCDAALSAFAQPVKTEAKVAAAAAAPSTAANPSTAPGTNAVDRQVGPMPSLAPLVESVKSAVVNVDVKAQVKNANVFMQDPFGGFFGMAPRQRQPPTQQGTGSGFIIDSSGRVLTNNHVVENAVNIRVRLDDGRAFDAKVLGRDPLTDLALLQLQGAKNLPTVKLGDSDAMRVGDYVVAIGNPFGLASSVSAGILSARARDIHSGPYDDFLQTDAAINPGNSGGPLFNLKGEVIGINSAIIGGATGIGFAVPSSTALALLPQLEGGQVRRGWLGVAIQDLTPDLANGLGTSAQRGALVAQVSGDTPAGRAGIGQDDVIVSIDGDTVESSRELTRAVGFKRPGTQVTLGVLRGSAERKVKVTLGERPDYEHLGDSNDAAPASADDRAEKLGLTLQNAANARVQGAPQEGALIVEVSPGSRAEDAGLRPGMVIVEAAGQKVRTARDFMRVVSGQPSGKTVVLRIDIEGTRVLRALPLP